MHNTQEYTAKVRDPTTVFVIVLRNVRLATLDQPNRTSTPCADDRTKVEHQRQKWERQSTMTNIDRSVHAIEGRDIAEQSAVSICLAPRHV
jgi:hypothetical protein